MPPDVTFDQLALSAPSINDAGHLAFSARAQLTNGGLDPSEDSGIWTNRDGALALIIREGDAAVGASPGAKFGELTSTLVLNHSGRIAFWATLTGNEVSSENNSAIWAEGQSSLKLIAREGSQAPGTPVGLTFDTLTGLTFNGRDQVAFSASLKPGVGVTSDNNFGIWQQDPAGLLELVVRKGDALQVAPGDIRTVSSLVFAGGSGNEDGFASSFNDSGQLAFRASFTDGTSGVFVSDQASFAAADFNRDGDVDGDDLIMLQAALGGDADHDGDSDGADFLIWQQQAGYRDTVAPSSTVPEPRGSLLAAAIWASSIAMIRLRSTRHNYPVA